MRGTQSVQQNFMPSAGGPFPMSESPTVVLEDTSKHAQLVLTEAYSSILFCFDTSAYVDIWKIDSLPTCMLVLKLESQNVCDFLFCTETWEIALHY